MKYVLGTVETQSTEVLENVEKTFLENYMDGAIPGILDFAIDVLLAIVDFAIGTRVIKWLVKIVKSSK